MNKQLYTGNTNRGRNLRSKKDQGYDLQFDNSWRYRNDDQNKRRNRLLLLLFLFSKNKLALVLS